MPQPAGTSLSDARAPAGGRRLCLRRAAPVDWPAGYLATPYPGPRAARTGGRLPAARAHRNGHHPPAAGVAAGILYAICWLVWAARTPAGDRLEAAAHSLTAVLVLCPLLWEATLRFHAISTWTAAALLLSSPFSAWPYRGARTC